MMSIGAWNSYVSSGSVIPLKEGGIKHRLTKYLRRIESWVLACTSAKIIQNFFFKDYQNVKDFVCAASIYVVDEINQRCLWGPEIRKKVSY